MTVWAITLLALAGLVVLAAVLNYFTDSAGLYHPGKSKQARNLRLRKLALLKGLRRAPCATLTLGSSRVFNLSLSGDARFPQPTLNFAVTTAKAEDYLAGYRLVREALGGEGARATIKNVFIGIEHPAFHPTMPPQWEAYTAGRYTQELQALGALHMTPAWRWRMLLSPVQTRQSLTGLQRRWRERKGAKQKFRWAADGSGTWLDLLEGRRNPRLLRRQLRSFPRTGLGLHSYTRVGAQRVRWFEELLAQCSADGTRAVAYIVPAHPLLVRKTWELGFKPMHEKLVVALADVCAKHGAQFSDWYDPTALGLDKSHFRDVMHLTDAGQQVVKEALAAL